MFYFNVTIIPTRETIVTRNIFASFSGEYRNLLPGNTTVPFKDSAPFPTLSGGIRLSSKPTFFFYTALVSLRKERQIFTSLSAFVFL